MRKMRYACMSNRTRRTLTVEYGTYRAQVVNIRDSQRGKFGRKLVGYDLSAISRA
jgi:hypothetical protein